MDIIQKINDVNKSKLDLNENILTLRTEFEAYIRNTNIPMLERWDLFLKAPNELSNELDSFPDFHYSKLGPGLSFFMSELLTEQHIDALESGSNTIQIKESVDQWFKRETNNFNVEIIRLYLENKDKPLTDKELNDYMLSLMEELLELNLASFDYNT